MRFLLDENFNNIISDAITRRKSDVDMLHVQGVPGLSGADDPTIPEWAARERRILLTHDVRTMPRYTAIRLAAGLHVSGVIEIRRNASIATIIEDLLILIECSTEEDWEGKVTFLPLR